MYNKLINIDILWDTTRVIHWNRTEVSGNILPPLSGSLPLLPWSPRWQVHLTRQHVSTKVHGFTSHKAVIFVETAVTTWNLWMNYWFNSYTASSSTTCSLADSTTKQDVVTESPVSQHHWFIARLFAFPCSWCNYNTPTFDVYDITAVVTAKV